MWLQKSYEQLLWAYDFTDNQVKEQTKLLKELARDERYSDRVSILEMIPGIGVLTAMELLLELQDVERFRTGGQLAAYVGLTPSQFSSGDRIRMGHITRVGKAHLRAVMIEAAWTLISKDKHVAELYIKIKNRAGKKRAIVAIARRMLLMTRSILINQTCYTSAA
jgi:transposase